MTGGFRKKNEHKSNFFFAHWEEEQTNSLVQGVVDNICTSSRQEWQEHSIH